MAYQLHSEARTTPKIRAEIQASTLGLTKLAKKYNITKATALKWRGRDEVEDRSHRPHKLNTTLNEAQEDIVVELRRFLLLPIDDLLVVTREFINLDVSRSGLGRCLTRHGVGNIRALRAEQNPSEEKKVSKKAFKNYAPGFIHIDIKYLPKMPDEAHHRYLFVAIDRATRWVYFRIYADQTQVSSVDFLRRVTEACPVHINKILTDNGTQFTDRFTSKEKKATGNHAFDKACTEHAIEHRLIPPRHPQTNGMVERFNGRISELNKQTHFTSAAELEATLYAYLKVYNHQIPQRALNHQTPIQALMEWQKTTPDIFTKTVHNHTGLDT